MVALLLLRVLFLLLALLLAAAHARTPSLASTILGVALGAVVIDLLFPRKNLVAAIAIFLGLAAGLILACLLGLVLQPVPMANEIRAAFQSLLAIVLGYACVSVLWQSQGEVGKWIAGRRLPASESPLTGQPWLLDTSAVIDGRIADVVDTGAVGGPLIAPAFVVAELQRIADNSDRSRRARGRRGLDVLNRLRSNPRAAVANR